MMLPSGRTPSGHVAIAPVHVAPLHSCLAHIRRKFFEAREDHPRVTAWILSQIAAIYRIEARLREEETDPLARQKARWTGSRRHYNRLTRLVAYLGKRREITPKSPLGQALAYAAGQLPHLEPCFLDSRIEWDNNLTECRPSNRSPEEEAGNRLAGAERRQNAIRPVKLGHKNWLQIGGEHTGWRSAVIYTFVEQVRSHGKDPFGYFEWVFDRLMRNPGREELPDLLPCAWLKLRSEPAAVEANVA